MKQTLLLTLLFLSTRATKSQQPSGSPPKALLLPNGQPDLSKLTCLPGLLRIFINENGELQQPIMTSPDHKDICPNLDVTCCSTDGLSGAADGFLKAYHEMEKTYVLAQGVYQWLGSLTEDEVLQVVKDKNPKSQSETEENYENSIVKFKASFKTVVANGKDLTKELKTIQVAARKHYAGFICEFCHPRLSDSAVLPKDSSSDAQVALSMNVQSYLRNYELLKSVFEFMKKHSDFCKVLVSLNANEDSLPNIVTSIAENKDNDTAKLLTECGAPNAWDSAECLKFVYESDHFFISFGAISWVGNELYKAAYSLLFKRFRLNPRVVVPEELVNEAVFYPIKNEKVNAKVFNVQFVQQGGFDMENNKLAEKFWKGAKIVTTFVIGLLYTALG